MKPPPVRALSNEMNTNSKNDKVSNNDDDKLNDDSENKESKAATTALASFKLLLLAMMVLQNSSTVLVGRFTRAGVPEAELYDVNHLITICELSKLLLSAALEYYTTDGQLWQSLDMHILQRPTDALKISVPAILYLVQNTLLYVALTNLTAPIFQVTYQAKLVTTAIVSVFMLKRTYTAQQWTSLVAISLGVAIVVLGEKSSSSSSKSTESTATAGNLVTGLTAVSIACFSSAMAGVYFEFVLKKPADASKSAAAQPSLWMRNIQLAFFSVVIAILQGLWKSNSAAAVATVGTALTAKSYLHGFSFWTWILVALQAGGGLLVAAVIKYADNVLKGLATGVSVVLSTALSMVFFGTPLTGQFAVGGAIILAAVYLFSNPLPAFVTGATGSGGSITSSGGSSNGSGSDKKAEGDAEMKNLLPA
jgi:UDP-sugar transporter A1/2/3